MMEKSANEPCCMTTDGGIGSFKVESVISIDNRGQMVLPKSIRDMAKIHAGDKLAVISWEKDGEVCCISLIKVEDLAEMVRGMLGPLMKGIMTK
jgi:AbrB family looped-hinge helix DNA binding protein